MKNFLINLLLLLIFLLLMASSLYGLYIPPNISIRPVGPMQVGIFKNGISLFQRYKKQYYTISPFNDYVFDNNNGRTAFISQDELNAGFYNSDYLKSPWTNIIQTVNGYFQKITPNITFYSQKTIKYGTQIIGNKLIVIRSFSGDDQSVITGITLSVHNDDYIYDSAHQLYNYQSDDDINAFEKFYSIKLTPQILREETRTEIKDKKIFIVNPDINAIIAVQAQKNQKLYINNDAKLIEIEETSKPKQNQYINTAVIQIFNNPMEAEKIL